ncbi:hypothetical protein BZM26_28120 [Paraburkholderia strydomiana]|nr:hypothetical protein BZM26_28120 [Paraburkholderia strydomiana]
MYWPPAAEETAAVPEADTEAPSGALAESTGAAMALLEAARRPASTPKRLRPPGGRYLGAQTWPEGKRVEDSSGLLARQRAALFAVIKRQDIRSTQMKKAPRKRDAS